MSSNFNSDYSTCDHFPQNYDGLKLAKLAIKNDERAMYFALLTRKRRLTLSQKRFQIEFCDASYSSYKATINLLEDDSKKRRQLLDLKGESEQPGRLRQVQGVLFFSCFLKNISNSMPSVTCLSE